MAVKRWVNLRPQYVDGSGNNLSGGRLFFYVAGTSTKQNTFTDSGGLTANPNPVVLNSLGEPSTEIWLTVGATYKVGLAIAGVDDPPASFLWTEDNIAPINDVTTTQGGQWLTFAGVPTFVSGTSFTVLGDQRQIFDNGRRVQTTNTGGTVYSNVSATPTYDGTRTTVTLTNDSGALDAGLSAVFYGMLSAINSSIPPHAGNVPAVQDQTDQTKDVVFSVANLPTGTRRVIDISFDIGDPAVCEARLTFTQGVAFQTADVTGANAVSLFLQPVRGDRIALFDGTKWIVYNFTQAVTVAVPAVANQMYDVFAALSAGSVILEVLAWTNDTTRATGVSTQNGVLVKTGDLTRRYMGSFRTTAVAGQSEDSIAKRYLWNFYNRVLRKMLVQETTSTWTYMVATFRQANANAANQLDFVVGIQESPVKAEVLVSVFNAGGIQAEVGIGIDSTTVNSADLAPFITTIASPIIATAKFEGFPGIGRHILTWLEQSVAAGTTTWEGNNAGALLTTHSGIAGELWG